MKTKIRIQNFKSLEDVTLELAPTTVFLGSNGAGKSSVLKCLEFVGKNLDNINSQKPAETIYKLSNEVDLGSFKEVVLNNDIKKELIFELKHKSQTKREYYNLGLAPKGFELPDLGVAPVGFEQQDFERKRGRIYVSHVPRRFAPVGLESQDSDSQKRSLLDDPYREEKIQILKRKILEKWLGKEIFDFFSETGWSELLLLNYSTHRRFAFVTKYFTNLNLTLKLSLINSEDKNNFKTFSLTEHATQSEISIVNIPNTVGKKAPSVIINLKNVPSIFNDIVNENFIWDFSGGWNNLKNVVRELIFWHIKQYSGVHAKRIKKSPEELVLFNAIAVLILLFEVFPNLIKKFLSIDHLPSIRRIPPHREKLVKNKKNDPLNDMFWIRYLTNYEELQVILLKDRILQKEYSLPKGVEFDLNDLDDESKDFIINNQKVIKKYFDKYLNYGVLNLIQKMRDLELARNIYLKKESGFIKIMVETISGAHINYSESSSGLIQLFPILAAISLPEFEPGKSEYIYIEQPELHLHPNLQSRVAEFCSNIEDTPTESVYFKTKFIVETHSEHLIRGYQLLIAQGKIKPQHIRFYYFNPVDNKTEVVNLKVDKLGNFITPWPNGFFSEASDLSFKLLEEQLKRQK